MKLNLLIKNKQKKINYKNERVQYLSMRILQKIFSSANPNIGN